MKVAIVCCAKMEENYIMQFIDHYRKLGFDHIFIADNNDVQYPIQLSDALSEYIQSGYVTLRDYRGIQRIQCKSYKYFYKEYSSQYDWFLFVDVDEFLFLRDFSNIKDFLSQSIFDGFNSILIPWIVYDDNDLLEYDDRDLIDRFTHEDEYVSNEFKSAYRGGLDIELSFHYSVDRGDVLKRCDAVGRTDRITSKNPHTRFEELTYISNTKDIAHLKHYRFKTIQEYIMTKVNRGRPCVDEKDYWLTQRNDRQLLDTFFKHNHYTREKEEYGLRLLKELREKRSTVSI